MTHLFNGCAGPVACHLLKKEQAKRHQPYRKGDFRGTVLCLFSGGSLMEQPRRARGRLGGRVVLRSHARSQPDHGGGPSGALHLLSAPGHQPYPARCGLYQRCGGRLDLGHPAQHSRRTVEHRHPFRRRSDGQEGTGAGGPLYRLRKLAHRRRVRRAGDDPVLATDGGIRHALRPLGTLLDGRFRHHGHHGSVFRGHAQGSLRRGARDAPLDRRLQHPDRGTALRHP